MKKHRITVRLTSQELESLEQLCTIMKASGISEMVRRLIKNQTGMLAKST